MDGIDILLSRKDMTFEGTVEYFKNHAPAMTSVFYSIAEEYRAFTFTVSGYTKAQVLRRFYRETLAALEGGNTFSKFWLNMNDFLKLEGYTGLGPLQADNILRANVQAAYNADHCRQTTDPGAMRLRPYWQYDAINDSRTCPSHLLMGGRAFPAGSPTWDTWFPPNGLRCRCTVKTLSKRQVEVHGLTVEIKPPKDITPDLRSSTNPAKTPFEPDLKGYPEPLVEVFRRREREREKGQSGRRAEQPSETFKDYGG